VSALSTHSQSACSTQKKGRRRDIACSEIPAAFRGPPALRAVQLRGWPGAAGLAHPQALKARRPLASALLLSFVEVIARHGA